MFARFLLSGLLLLSCSALLLKSLLLVWSPQSFAVLTFGQQLKALLWGFRFDLAAAAMLWTPVALLCWLLVRLGVRRLHWLWWAVPIIVLAGVQCADLMYFDNSGRHIGYEVAEFSGEFGGLFMTAVKQYPALMLCLLGVVLICIALCRRYSRLPDRTTLSNTELPFVLMAVIAVFCGRCCLNE